MSSKVGSRKGGEEPKKPMTSYLLWLQANRDEVTKKFPTAKKSFMKRAGGMWKNLEDKSHWETLARKAKKDYEKAMEEYEKGSSKVVSSNNNKRKQPTKNGKKTKKEETDDDGSSGEEEEEEN